MVIAELAADPAQPMWNWQRPTIATIPDKSCTPVFTRSMWPKI